MLLNLVAPGMRVLLSAGLVLAISSPAAAGAVYSWVTEDGVYAYADSTKRIPKRYRGEAKTRSLGKLVNYERWTPSDRTAEGSYTDRLSGNLERLSKLNAKPAKARRHARVHGKRHRHHGAAVPMMTIRAGGGRYGRGGVDIQIPMYGDDGEPVEVESVRARDDVGDGTRHLSSIATRHLTLVKRGDKVLLVLKGEKADSSAYPAYEAELQ
jgi:hypothetical protein